MIVLQNKASIDSLLNKYIDDFPEEMTSVHLFRAFLTDGESLTRAQEIGHFTASAWIINQNRDMALLTHHAKLDLWLQLGGHIEEGETVSTAALREASEESGLKSVKLLSSDLYDIDAHLIPERKDLEEHYHFDLRFLIEADSDEALQMSSESKDLTWMKIQDIRTLNDGPSVMRMVDKMSGSFLARI